MGLTKRLMAAGDWSIELKPETPQTVRDNFGKWEHIIVTEVRVDPTAVGDTGMKAQSIYTGILTDFDWASGQTPITLGGPHVHAHLGDGDIGDIYETQKKLTSVTDMPTVVSTLLPTAVTIGTVATVSGSYTGKHKYQQPAEAIRKALDVGFSAEYRVNDDGTLDADLPGVLFVGSPTAMVIRGGGSDPVINAAKAEELRSRQDVRDLTTKVVLLGETNSRNRPAKGTATRTHSFTDLHGNALVRKQIIAEPDVEKANVAARAANVLAAINREDEEVSIDLTPDYIVVGTFNVGDEIYVFDPDSQLFDTSNHQYFQGQVVFPKSVRVLAYTTPVAKPMGVYHRDRTGAYTDLTDYVVWESTQAPSMEVGQSHPYMLEQSQRNSGIIRNLINSIDDEHGFVSMNTGTLSEPSVFFENDTDTGLYWVSNNKGALVAGGSLSAYWEAGKFQIGADTAQPRLIVDSTSTGDNWTSQGALIAIGESATNDASGAALRLAYHGNGQSYIGAGQIDGLGGNGAAVGIPDEGAISFKWNQKYVGLLRASKEAFTVTDNGDMYWYKDDGTTVAMQYDESDAQIEFHIKTLIDNATYHYFNYSSGTGAYLLGCNSSDNFTLSDSDGNPRLRFYDTVAGAGADGDFRLYSDNATYIIWWDASSGSIFFQDETGQDLVTMDAGYGSGLAIKEDLTDIGNHEVLRANRTASGTAVTEVGYYSSYRHLKADIVFLNESEEWDRDLIDQIEPVKYRRKMTGGREFGFILEDLAEVSPFLTTKGEEIGHSPDEFALLAVAIDAIKDLRARVAELEGRLGDDSQ